MSGYTETLFSQSMAGFFHRSESAVIDNVMRQDLVSKSRVLITKVPLAKAIIDVLLRGVVGSGLHLDSEYADGFDLLGACQALDANGELDFFQMQQQIWQTALTCGECFLIRQKAGEGFSSWYIAEPDHVKNPPYAVQKGVGITTYKNHLLIDGIEYRSNGKPYAIHYCVNPYTGGQYDKRNWRRIFLEDPQGIRNVVHVKLLDRPEYPRGLPILAPVIETLYGLYAYQVAQIQMGIIQSSQAYVIKTENPDKSLNPLTGFTHTDLNSKLIPDNSEENREHEDARKPSEFSIIPPAQRNVDGTLSNANFISPGMSYHLGIGESIEHLSTTGPSNSLSEYYDLVLSECAAALGIPKAILSNVFDTSFSSCKASIAQWNFTVSKHRKAFINQCLKPIFKVFMQEAYTDMDALEIATTTLKSQWKSVDPPLFADESKTLRFYLDALDAGLIARDEAAQALFGHPADGVVKVEVVEPAPA